MKKIAFLVLLLLKIQLVCAQQDTIELKTVSLSDNYLMRFSETQSKILLSDSVLQRNGPLLTSLLNFNSTIFFKESGAGMVSSPSFRGTTASQTAVVWNGININSQFLGQSDFNTVNTTAFNSIIIKSGGGSVAYGSGAVGGSIHLNNELSFNKGFENNLHLNAGDFGLYGVHYKSTFSDEKTSFQLNVGRNGSENDYPYQNSERKNLNGQFYNNTISMSAAHKLNSKNTVRLYGNIFDGERHFSLTSPNSIPTKYHDSNTRLLIEWNSIFGKFNSTVKTARLSEEYRYFPTLNSTNYEQGNGETWIAKYDLSYEHKNLLINGLLDFSHAEGSGSQIEFAKRQTASAGLLLKHKLKKNLLYEASIRQEISDVYNSPFLYSLGMKWHATSYYQLRINSSKNFRMPTFNDLYWPGSGNPDLNPEVSIQSEIGNQFRFFDVNFEITAYHNSIKNLIQWIPMGSISVPENVGKVEILGVESTLNYLKKWSNQQMEINLTYAYNHSEDQRKSKQLIYVPYHKSTASLAYSRKWLSAYYQFLYNGKVFTDSNNRYELKDHTISNLGLELNMGRKRNYRIGAQVLNLWNEDYQNVLNRPMPGRNYNVYINLKF